MTSECKISWTDANQAFLVAEFARLKQRLGAKHEGNVAEAIAAARREMESPPAIDWLSELFGLSPFERDILLLCAGVEMDSALAALCGEARGGPPRAYATFGLALAVLAEPHWSALTPSRPLRRFRLVEVDAGAGLTSAPLRIDEAILHYLAAGDTRGSRLQPIIQPSPFPEWIADEHKTIAARLALVFDAYPQNPPVLHLCGDDPQGQEDAAALAVHDVGRRLFTARTEDLPPVGPELDQLSLLWQREAMLVGGALLIQCAPGGITPSARHLVERLPGIVVLASREPAPLNRAFLRFDVDKPKPIEQRRLWERALGPAAAQCNGQLDDLSEQFRLSARTIFATGALTGRENGLVHPRELWNMCRSFSRPRLEDLAQRLTPTAGWEDLVLPEFQMLTLRQLASQVRQRMKVYETWGFSARGRRGLGVSALFTGDSGVGKTLAAEVLAHDLELDLYRVDVSAVVSKYIGETSRNVKQVFDAAEEGGVLLLFDEADALFGKRGEVRDSHDRYANIDVAYLLQRMEAYQGLAILTTNMKTSVDRAFQRRLRFTVNFPFPDASQRQAIWSRIFPAQTPTRGLDFRKLSQLNVAGGNILNIALNAAFLAAESDGPVEMAHVLQAARLEAQKIERALSDAEIRGWV
jgi:ATPase family associated with various cellular activities (AAA)